MSRVSSHAKANAKRLSYSSLNRILNTLVMSVWSSDNPEEGKVNGSVLPSVRIKYFQFPLENQSAAEETTK